MSTLLTPEATGALTAGHLAHLVTINPDGSPQASIIWIGVEGDVIVSGHIPLHKKLRNVQRDPRVSISMQLPGRNAYGLDHYIVVEGTARVTEGGAGAAPAARARLPRARCQVPADARPATRLRAPHDADPDPGRPAVGRRLLTKPAGSAGHTTGWLLVGSPMVDEQPAGGALPRLGGTRRPEHPMSAICG